MFVVVNCGGRLASPTQNAGPGHDITSRMTKLPILVSSADPKNKISLAVVCTATGHACNTSCDRRVDTFTSRWKPV